MAMNGYAIFSYISVTEALPSDNFVLFCFFKGTASL